jgi:nucleoside-diphosphate-sugar epimerase
MTRILLTGATGFVGRQVLRELRARGAQVSLVLRSGRDVPDGAAAVHITDDLFSENAKFWRAACAGIDTIVHVAWYAEPGKYVTSPENLTCMSGTIRMAQAAAAAGVKRFVGIGTCFEYDLAAGLLRTSTPLAPRNPYGAAKAGTYLALSRTLPGMGVAFAWARLFYLYGEGEDPRRLVPYLHERLSNGKVAELSSGNQIRDYLDVAEAGRRIAGIALSQAQGTFNISSGIPLTVRQLAERIAGDYRRPDLLRFGARPDNPDDPPCVIGEPTHLPASRI